MTGRKIALNSIKTLTFYAGEQTTSRRTTSIPQLKCLGRACREYQPEVVQCINVGEDGGGGIQWKCETDLPSAFRLGKVQISCEGYSHPGDENVLQGSCGLEYNLIKVDRKLEYGEGSYVPRTHWFSTLFTYLFQTLFMAIILYVIYTVLRLFLRRFFPRWTLPYLGPPWFPGGGGGPNGGGRGGGGSGSDYGGWGGEGGNGGNDSSRGDPPPYSKNPSPQPGFWTGALTGIAGSWLYNIWTNRRWDWTQNDRRRYDWERNNHPTRVYRSADGLAPRRPVVSPGIGRWDDWDDHTGGRPGPSTSTMRRATGFGGTVTR